MSKQKLWILTVALSLALVGLVIIQLFWMKNAIDLKEEQFEQLVNGTLDEVAQAVEKYYTSVRIESLMDVQPDIDVPIQWNVEIEKKAIPPPHLIKNGNINERDTAEKAFIEVATDSIVIVTLTDAPGKDTIVISELAAERRIKQFEESMQRREKLLKKVMKEMLLEDVSFGERISEKEFSKILQHNLSEKGLDFPYEYAVMEQADREIYGTEGFNPRTSNYIFRTGLMGDKLLDNTTYLYLYFPGQKKYIRGTMGMLGSSTILFTVFMVISFAFALYVIFRQKKLSDIKSDFVSNMTHELKTPISTISLASQMLSDTSIPEEKKNMRHISRIIQTESKRLGYQVERVLQMAVLDQGHLVLKKTSVNLHDLIHTVEHNFSLQVESLHGTLTMDYGARNDEVYGDRVHLTNVITNLVDNAIKYSPDTPKIQLKTFNERGTLCITVEDNGIGISKENQKKVFEKFFRVSTGNVHDVKGFGLGLSYVKLIVEQHGGTISLNSELNYGTTFKITLPLINEKYGL
jgi:signal transduction histidine kinase